MKGIIIFKVCITLNIIASVMILINMIDDRLTDRRLLKYYGDFDKRWNIEFFYLLEK